MTDGVNTKRALLIGYFSTVGDIESLDVVRDWLDGIGISYDMAPFKEIIRAKMRDVIALSEADPGRYSHLVIICGPLWKEQLEKVPFDISRFGHCVRIGINLTMVEPIQGWNPFNILLERDGDRISRPDLTLIAETPAARVVGLCMVKKQSSYKGRERHEEVRALFGDVIERHGFGVIELDSRWFRAVNGLKTPAHFLSAIQRVDLLLTNRLHGMVFAIKAGVPVIAIDAIEGRAKVTAQSKAIGWPQCLAFEDATPERLDAAVSWCFSPEARETVLSCRREAITKLQDVKQEFLAAF